MPPTSHTHQHYVQLRANTEKKERERERAIRERERERQTVVHKLPKYTIASHGNLDVLAQGKILNRTASPFLYLKTHFRALFRLLGLALLLPPLLLLLSSPVKSRSTSPSCLCSSLWSSTSLLTLLALLADAFRFFIDPSRRALGTLGASCKIDHICLCLLSLSRSLSLSVFPLSPSFFSLFNTFPCLAYLLPRLASCTIDSCP